MVLDKTIDDVQNVLKSEMEFLDKLKYIISVKVNSHSNMKGDFIKEFVRRDHEIGEFIQDNYQKRFKEIMFAFFDEGKKANCINNNISNESIYLYVEIFKAGLNEKALEIRYISESNKNFEDLINLYFYGIVKNK